MNAPLHRMNEQALDTLVFTALSGRQARFATGDPAHALAFDPAVGPFAAARDDSKESLEALAPLLEGTGACMAQSRALCFPQGLRPSTIRTAIMLVRRSPRQAPEPREGKIIELGLANVPAMQALTAATKPGPFGPRTYELGHYFGIFDKGELVAMAGERMAIEGFTEVSAVCTHPDYRGRGLAAALAGHVAAGIEARGERPFLHSFVDNQAALHVYEKLGFEPRSEIHLAAGFTRETTN